MINAVNDLDVSDRVLRHLNLFKENLLIYSYIKEKLTDAGNETRDQENIRQEKRKVKVGLPK